MPFKILSVIPKITKRMKKLREEILQLEDLMTNCTGKYSAVPGNVGGYVKDRRAQLTVMKVEKEKEFWDLQNVRYDCQRELAMLMERVTSSARLRQVIVRHYGFSWSFVKIAERLNISVSATRKYHERAIKCLTVALSNDKIAIMV